MGHSAARQDYHGPGVFSFSLLCYCVQYQLHPGDGSTCDPQMVAGDHILPSEEAFLFWEHRVPSCHRSLTTFLALGLELS